MKRNVRSGPASRRRWMVPAMILSGLFAAVLAADWWVALEPGLTSNYVGRQTCSECHQKELDEWTGSDHDRAMELASDASVLGDFDDAQFAYQGVTSRMFKRDGKFFVHTEGPTGEFEDFEIKYTFGVRPLQQYMVEFPDGRVQVLRISWDTQQKRWFYVPPPDVLDERILPGDPLHWTGTAQNWNHTCADCHSTDVHKNYDLATNTYKTSYAEIDVSCEACHGPGEIHVQLARSNSLFWDRNYGYGLPNLKDKKNTRAQLETCAKCHSRRNMIHPNFTAGSELLDYYELELLRADTYHADGQIKDEVYVHGSFLQSQMFHKNVRCTDCHNPHSTKVKFEGNRLCAQCHQPGKYDGPVHHHHKPGTKGASCVECHMPETTYMVVDPRRDHSIRVPRPDLSVKLGTPNACNGCHTHPDESAAWAAEKVRIWFGPKRPDDPHYGPAIAAGQEGKPEGESLLIAAIRRRETPDIVRATAIELLSQYGSAQSVQSQKTALQHNNPLVRTAAVRAVPLGHSAGDVLALLGPRLNDPIRSVRMAAARRLVVVPRELFTPTEQTAMDRALVEFEQAQLQSADRAGAHLNLGNLYQELGKVDLAIQSFQTAIRLEPYLAGARSNLASLVEAAGNPEKALRLRQDELELLARDVRLLPANADVQNRYGLTLYLIGRIEESQAALERACELNPDSYRYRQFLTLLYEKQEKWDQARQSLEILEQLAPGNPQTQSVRERIERAAGG